MITTQQQRQMAQLKNGQMIWIDISPKKKYSSGYETHEKILNIISL